MPGWVAFIWQHFRQRVVIVCPTEPRPHFVQVERFVRGLGEKGRGVLVETSVSLDGSVEEELRARGWEVGYALPVHLLPVGDEGWRARLLVHPSGYTVREVTDEETVSHYAWVQDQAYRETYDLPRGCQSLFYASPGSLCGPDVLAAVLYDDHDRPVRTACLVRAHGLVSGVGGAAVPSVRGQHLGEPLMRHLGWASVQRFAADEVVHITMPVARPIARRLGLGVVDTYRRWVPGGGVEW